MGLIMQEGKYVGRDEIANVPTYFPSCMIRPIRYLPSHGTDYDKGSRGSS